MIYGRLKFVSSGFPVTARHRRMPEPAQRRLSDHFCYFLGQNVGCFGIERPPYRGEKTASDKRSSLLYKKQNSRRALVNM